MLAQQQHTLLKEKSIFFAKLTRRERKSKDESVQERVIERKGKYLADVKQCSAPWQCVVYRYETNFDSA